jgi:hypothetical protein
MGEGKALSAKLNKHFAALGAAAAAVTGVGIVEQAQAAVVSSGPVNINIPSTTAGIYLNFVTGVSGTAAGTPGWDVNPWSSTGLGLFNPAAPAGGVYVGTAPGGTQARNLPVGEIIGPASIYGSNSSAAANANVFNAGSNNLIGVRFQNEANGNQIHYGWMRISLVGPGAAAGTQPRAIVEYAYESDAGVGIPAGVPEPASLGLLAAGAMGLLARRR